MESKKSVKLLPDSVLLALIILVACSLRFRDRVSRLGKALRAAKVSREFLNKWTTTTSQALMLVVKIRIFTSWWMMNCSTLLECMCNTNPKTRSRALESSLPTKARMMEQMVRLRPYQPTV